MIFSNATAVKVGSATVTRIYVGTTSVYNSIAAAYIAAVEAADGASLESNVKTAIYNFVDGCMSDNIWSAIQDCCIMAGARTLAGALVPLKGIASTNGGLSAATYSRALGPIGGGASYLNSNKNNTDYSRNDMHAAIYATATATGVVLGSDTATGGIVGLRPFNGASSAFAIRNNSVTVTGATSTGFAGGSRSNSSNFDYIHPNSGGIVNVTQASTLGTASLIYIFARSSSSPANYSGRLSFYSLGSNLNLILLRDRVNTLMTAFASL